MPWVKGREKRAILRSIYQAVGLPSEEYMKKLDPDHLPACIVIESVISMLDAQDAGSTQTKNRIFPGGDDTDRRLLSQILSLNPLERPEARAILREPYMAVFATADVESSAILDLKWDPIKVPLDEEDEDDLVLDEIKATLDEVILTQPDSFSGSSSGCACQVM